MTFRRFTARGPHGACGPEHRRAGIDAKAADSKAAAGTAREKDSHATGTEAMSRVRLPSVGALTAFEAAARHGSFSRAATELNLTQGAISRQIRQIEDMTGVTLFERVRQRVVLTDAGRLYFNDVSRLLHELSEATHRVTAFAGGDGTLNLAVLPTFATRWLMPRMPDFLERHPGATINFTVRIAPFDLVAEPFDAVIHYGEPEWPGAICEPLMREEMVPVAGAGFRARHGIAAPSDLAGLTLLHQSTRPTAWSDWFEAAGLPTANAWRGPRFEQFSMIAQAAAAGLGVALVPRFLVEEELESRRLEILFDRPLFTDKAYFVVYLEQKAGSSLVRAFTRWIRAKAGSE